MISCAICDCEMVKAIPNSSQQLEIACVVGSAQYRTKYIGKVDMPNINSTTTWRSISEWYVVRHKKHNIT